MDSRRKALLAAQAALAKHAENVVVLDLRGLSPVTDYFVICTADSAPQMTAVNDHMERLFKEHGCAVFNAEGSSKQPLTGVGGIMELRWVLLDCGDVVVHLFDSAARSLYRLEDLWADAPRLALPPQSPAAARRTLAA